MSYFGIPIFCIYEYEDSMYVSRIRIIGRILGPENITYVDHFWKHQFKIIFWFRWTHILVRVCFILGIKFVNMNEL